MPNIRDIRWSISQRTQRWARAWRYATGRMTEDDADRIRYECQDVGGFWPLETLTLDGFMESITDQYCDAPELRRLARAACARVYHKWGSTGDTQGAAEDWAREVFCDYAESDGVALRDLYEEAAGTPFLRTAEDGA